MGADWREVIRRKKELLNNALNIMMNHSRIDAVEISKKLGVDVNTFILFLSEDLISIAKSHGFSVIYGSYNPETGAVRDKIIKDDKNVIVPIFIRK